MPSDVENGPARNAESAHPKPSVTGRFLRLLPRLALIGAVLLLLFAVAMFVFRVSYSDRIYPAVAVGDVPVGGMTVDEAVAAVEMRAAELEEGSIAFTYGGETWTPSLSEIGAEVDADASVDQAFALGRQDNAVSRLGFTNQILKDDQVVPLRTTVDRAVLNTWFESVNNDIGQRAVDATLVVDGTSVSITPEVTGIVVDPDAATAIVLQNLESLEPATNELPTMVEQPQVFASDLQEATAKLERSLSSPVVVTFEGQNWDIAPADLVAFLDTEVKAGSGDVGVAITMDKDGLSTWLRDRFSGEINRSPEDARIGWRQGEGLLAIEPSVDGAALRSNAFSEEVAASFLNGSGPVDIPVVLTAPEIDSKNLDALKINSRLARGDSNYGGQKWQRDTNIEVATDYLTGTLVKPGEEFSFNAAIGEINQERGFVESGVILNGRASTGDGGGVCQVSTTVFRAAILAGLPITDWEEHTQRLKIYEQDGWTAGYDASILQWGDDPSLWGDLKFLNDTGGYILIQAWNDYPYNIVEIYGNDDGREVQVSDANIWEGTSYPDSVEVVDESLGSGVIQQTEWPRMPMETLFTMTVTYADGTVKEQEFYSLYRGSGNVWTVSPDMRGQSPAG